MSGKHQIFVYRCRNCGKEEETMDTKDYLEKRMEKNPELYACCSNPDLKQVDQYFR